MAPWLLVAVKLACCVGSAVVVLVTLRQSVQRRSRPRRNWDAVPDTRSWW